jgi:hypothetical protein
VRIGGREGEEGTEGVGEGEKGGREKRRVRKEDEGKRRSR